METGAPPLTRATVADVARLAAVSGKTVSRVFAGETNVSPDTRQRVLDAATRLRFRPNHLARDLRRGGVSTTVAFVMGDLSNPFYSMVAAGIEKELAAHGLTLLLATTGDDPTQEHRVVAAMLERRVRSLLIVPIAADQSYLEGERQLGTPVVCIDRPGCNVAADSVVLANLDGAAEAVRSLVCRGHRRIGFVGSAAGVYTHEQRRMGYRQALLDVGVTPTPEWERSDASDTDSAAAATREMLALPHAPTAILAGNNRASPGVLRALREHASPVAFIGFDDFDLADFLGVTVVTHDPQAMGREAVRLAVLRQADPTTAVEQVVLPTRLLRRGSGELLPPPDAG